MLPASAPPSRPTNRRQCPCKTLPHSLSSFTAAEYGDLHSLSRLGPSVATRFGAGGYSPLHLAAQNGHTAATSLLLSLGADVDGRPPPTDQSIAWSGATPLHRASYSGAVSSMRILLGWSSPRRCDVLAGDTSFGDLMTPLHKAAAGGRYLSVQLLLDALRSWNDIDAGSAVRMTQTSAVEVGSPYISGVVVGLDQATTSLDAAGDDTTVNENRSTSRDLSMLQRGLLAVDSLGRTPLAVARHFLQNQDKERRSVKRWDAVAGGVPDWVKCVDLLEAALEELGKGLKVEDAPSSYSVGDGRFESSKHSLVQSLDPLPEHLSGVRSCLDCGSDDNGQCKTASWEAAFRSLLLVSVEEKTKSRGKYIRDGAGTTSPWQTDSKHLLPAPPPIKEMDPSIKTCSGVIGDDVEPSLQNLGTANTALLGQHCSACGMNCMALYRSKANLLVCKKCLRRAKQSK